MVDDRPGDELREERDEKRVIEQIVLPGLSPVRIDQKSDLLEREEGDGQRQRQMQQRQRRVRERIDVLEQEIGIFEIAQQRDVQ